MPASSALHDTSLIGDTLNPDGLPTFHDLDRLYRTARHVYNLLYMRQAGLPFDDEITLPPDWARYCSQHLLRISAISSLLVANILRHQEPANPAQLPRDDHTARMSESAGNVLVDTSNLYNHEWIAPRNMLDCRVFLDEEYDPRCVTKCIYAYAIY